MSTARKSKSKDPYIFVEWTDVNDVRFSSKGEYHGANYKQSYLPTLFAQLRARGIAEVTLDEKQTVALALPRKKVSRVFRAETYGERDPERFSYPAKGRRSEAARMLAAARASVKWFSRVYGLTEVEARALVNHPKKQQILSEVEKFKKKHGASDSSALVRGYLLGLIKS